MSAAAVSSPAPARRSGARSVASRPGLAQGIDIGFVLALSALALIGLRSVFFGWDFALAGMLGVVVGVVVAQLGLTIRLPLIGIAALSVIAFFLCGGAVALRDTRPGGAAPSVPVMRALASEAIHGWKDLLTTLPPADGKGALLVLPYLLGVVSGAGAVAVAGRLRAALAPVIFPAIALVVVILMGTTRPAAGIWQGLVFACVGLVWGAVRYRRSHPVTGRGSARRGRLVTGGATLALVAAGTWAAGAILPGTSSRDRVVLRSYVTPPFDINNYPSPLVGFRKYTKDAKALYDSTLFTVSGLPANTPIKIATLDSYDGSVWGATQDPGVAGSAQTDAFQQVGQHVPGTATGPIVRVTVTIGQAYAASHDVDAWLPEAGNLRQITFSGARQAAYANDFRLNLATDSGILPERLAAGDRYTFSAVLPDDSLGADPQPYGASSLDSDAYAFLASKATEWAAPSGSADSQASDVWAQVSAVARHLQSTGAYSDGGKGEEQYLPGHSVFRLSSFLAGQQPVGDDEQYAATFALMANDLGLPARVVLGAVPEPGGAVKGQDIHAWVEVHVADGRWVDVSQKLFMPNVDKKPLPQQQQKPQKASSSIVPPPQAARPPNAETSGQAQAITARAPKGRNRSHFHLPAWLVHALRLLGPPVTVIAALVLLVTGLKARRRRVRRTRGSPTHRLARGWSEVLDHARDLGIKVPGLATRREQSRVLELPQVEALASIADAGVFGPGEPSEEEVATYWVAVQDARKAMSARVGRFRRLVAALNVRSLVATRRLRRQPATAVAR